MKTRSLVLVFFSLLMAPVVFAGTYTNCVNSPSLSDGSGGFVAQFVCNFYREPAVYPLFLNSFMTYGGADLGENELIPGYIVWTSDSSDYNNQTMTDPGAFQDVLYFYPNLGGLYSSEVSVYWAAIGFPTVNNMEDLGYLTLPYDPSGVESLTDPNHTYNVDENFPATVPEPSTLIMVLAGGLGTLIVRRRRC